MVRERTATEGTHIMVSSKGNLVLRDPFLPSRAGSCRDHRTEQTKKVGPSLVFLIPTLALTLKTVDFEATIVLSLQTKSPKQNHHFAYAVFL